MVNKKKFLCDNNEKNKKINYKFSYILKKKYTYIYVL